MVQGLVAEGRPGNQLGRYRIESELGRGAMGVVYEARDTLLGRVVAVKILSDGLAGDPREMTRLLGEARLLAALHHPNIATIHGAGRSDDGIGYLVLERVQGESLDVRLSRGPLAPERALDVCRQIVRALRAAHERDIVHCDLKPANVMLTPDGLIKVLDFGLARRAIEPVRRGPITGSASEPPPGHSQVSSIAGTPGYMSPEQLMGEHPEPPTDVFAFGCVLFECLTGKRAFP
jgi:serine/threonine protein kinase